MAEDLLLHSYCIPVRIRDTEAQLTLDLTVSPTLAFQSTFRHILRTN